MPEMELSRHKSRLDAIDESHIDSEATPTYSPKKKFDFAEANNLEIEVDSSAGDPPKTAQNATRPSMRPVAEPVELFEEKPQKSGRKTKTPESHD